MSEYSIYEINAELVDLPNYTVNLDLDVKPDKLSQLQNDVGFITISAIGNGSLKIYNNERTLLGEFKANQFTDTDIVLPLASGLVDDVMVNNISVVSNKVAYIDLTPYATNLRLDGVVEAFDGEIENLENNKQDKISDLTIIRTGAALGATSLQPNDNISELNNDAGYITEISESDVINALGFTPYNATNPSNYQNATQVNSAISDATSSFITKDVANLTNYTTTTDLNTLLAGKQPVGDYATNTALSQGLATKQDTISDIAIIRSNATNGQSAYTTISTYGDIVTHDVNEFATAEQGAKADSAVQPEELSNYVPTSRKINGQALTQDLTISTASALSELTDVSLTTLSDNQILKYNATTQKWENGTGGGGASSFADLSGDPYDNTNLGIALDAKQDLLTSDNAGENITIEVGGGHNLPEGYQEVEYLQSTNTQYIDTGFIPTETTSFKVKFVRLQQTSGVTFAAILNSGNAYNSSDTFGLCVCTAPTQKDIILYRGSKFNIYLGSYNLNDIAEVSFTSTLATFNNLTLGTTYTTNISGSYTKGTRTAYLFKGNNGTADLSKIEKLRIYYTEIYDNEVLVRNLIPCYRKSDNVAGMYNLAYDAENPDTGLEFYTNAGTGQFLVGQDVNPTTKINATVPTVNNNTITFTQGGVTKGSITLNQNTDETIELDAGGSSYTPGNGIIINNDEISVDTTVISPVFDAEKGLELFQGGSHGLPDDYQEVEYLQSTGTQYINTGFSAPNGFITDMDISDDYSNISNHYYILGSHNPSSPYGRNYISVTKGYNALSIGAGGNSTESNAISLLRRYNIKASTVQNNIYLKIDNVTQSITIQNPETVRSDKPLWLYFLNGYAAGDTKNFIGKVYFCKIYNNTNVLVRDLIPCYRKSDGVAGFYNQAYDAENPDTGLEFYTNSATTGDDFVLGTNVYDRNKLNVKYDNQTIKLNASNELYATATPVDIDGTTITKNTDDELQAVSLVNLTTTVTELNYVDGVTSNIQTQLNAKANSSDLEEYTATEVQTLWESV